MSDQESIYTLLARVREHPDFAGGIVAIFTRREVADAVFESEDGCQAEATAEYYFIDRELHIQSVADALRDRAEAESAEAEPQV